jgi:Ca2+-dependent lipid-binding protein
LNIRELILTVVSSSLNSTLLFPNKLDVQMSNQKIPERSLVPEGLLQLTIIQAQHLMVADMFTSDPYVIVSWGDKELGRTEIKYENLNPVISHII